MDQTKKWIGREKNTTNELNYLREIDITLLLTISNSQLEIQLIETIEIEVNGIK